MTILLIFLCVTGWVGFFGMWAFYNLALKGWRQSVKAHEKTLDYLRAYAGVEPTENTRWN